MSLDDLRAAAEAIARDVPQRELVGAFDRIARSYDAAPRRTPVATSTDAIAYACARAPGTFTAVERALAALALVRPDWEPRTLLDLGAGTGSATWAALEVFPSIADVTLVESSAEMITAGRRIAESAGGGPLTDTTWIAGDAARPPSGTWDLVVASYVLGELPEDVRAAAVGRWFEATAGELVVLEPGSRDGFDVVLRARDRLIELGATITAPCPHEGTCPMPADDWCHFGVRVQRSRLQRRVKSGERGYEDEKFSYVVASKRTAAARESRVVGPPERRGGHVRLKLCTTDGLDETVVAKRAPDRYRRARNLAWGDSVDDG
jgi:ribosomal protein RSM22 (predicted rRNA methylase)